MLTFNNCSRDYYNDYQHLFHESPDYFYQFLKSDISLLSKLLNERTNVKLETIQLQNGVQFMKNFVNQRLHKTPLQEFEKVKLDCFVFLSFRS